MLVVPYIVCQAVLNLYMKFVMSNISVAPGVTGLPASFLVTGVQQLVALVVFMFLIANRSLSDRGQDRKASERGNLKARDRVVVCWAAAAFAANMSLNNFSLAFIPLSVNQVIRACMPLATALLSGLSGRQQDSTVSEWLIMIVGVACAVLTVVARTEGQLVASGGFVFGATLCGLSVICGAIDLVLKQVMRSELGIPSREMVGYVAMPAFLLLLVPGVLWSHRVPEAWAVLLGNSQGAFSDLTVMAKAVSLQPMVLVLCAFSGVLAFGYNALTAKLAGRLSATTTSFVGNFPTTVLISLLFLEKRLPAGGWGVLLWASMLGNIASFALYNVTRTRRLARQKSAAGGS